MAKAAKSYSMLVRARAITPRIKPKTSFDCTWLPIRSAILRPESLESGDEIEASAKVRVLGWKRRVRVNCGELVDPESEAFSAGIP